MFKELELIVGRDYEGYFNQVRDNYKLIDNPFWYYEKLLKDLSEIEHLDILPIKDFVSLAEKKDKVAVGFRHDIDADPITAVRCSRALARLGLSGSFYFLHTAIYYGEFYQDIFIRNPSMVLWIKEMIIAGSEIGIHNDALGVYKFFNQNGLKHFQSELNWMRSCGASISGTTAHNNALIYRAENYEIFEEAMLFKRPLFSGQKRYLGNLTLGQMSLEYEGTFAMPKKQINRAEVNTYFKSIEDNPVSKKDWFYNYFNNNPVNDWSVDSQFWIIGKNQWVFSGSKYNNLEFDFGISLSKVIDIIKQMKLGTKTLFVLHPVYFGGY